MEFLDKNGELINIGDVVRPDEGQDCVILTIAYNNDIRDVVMYGQQLQNSACFSIFTKDNLALQFTKISLNN